MTELCHNGHVRTAENTRWYKHGRGDKLKRRCDDCRKAKTNTGRPSSLMLSKQRTTELHEDIADMIRFGSSFSEIVERSGYASWESMRKSLTRRGRTDLLEVMRKKRNV